MVKGKIKQSAGDRIFQIFAHGFVAFWVVLCLLPFLRVISQALSSTEYVLSGEITIFPKGFTLEHVKYVFTESGAFLDALWISVKATVVYTVLALTFTILTAYPLSRPCFGARNILYRYFVFTMIFNGGVMPTYLVVKQLGLLDTFWALIIPTLISVYNMIIVVTSFRSTPVEYEEAAKIDGASNFKILFSVMIPLNKPTLAVILLYYAVYRWNGWYDAMMYTNDRSLRTIQLFAKSVIEQGNTAITRIATSSPTTCIKAATVLIAIAPILVLYPFLQKYFVKGALIGGIKG